MEGSKPLCTLLTVVSTYWLAVVIRKVVMSNFVRFVFLCFVSGLCYELPNFDFFFCCCWGGGRGAISFNVNSDLFTVVWPQAHRSHVINGYLLNSDCVRCSWNSSALFFICVILFSLLQICISNCPKAGHYTTLCDARRDQEGGGREEKWERERGEQIMKIKRERERESKLVL